MRKQQLLLATILGTSLGMSVLSTPVAFAQATDDEIVVTGTRSQTNRTALESPVPVDAFDLQDLTSTGRTDLNRILAATVPSFNFNQTAINDGTDIIRPAQLRGLGADQTLVLVNGKRRHTSALLNLTSNGRGSAAVDLNAIPSAAVGSIQVLRDGASAQYGSDAIAGVINVLLRDDNSGGGFNAQYGAYATDPEATGRGNIWDGETLVLSGWAGFEIGDGGHVTVSAEYKDRETINRAGLDPRNQYRNAPDGTIIPEGDARERTFDRLNHIYGSFESDDFSAFLNAGIPINENAEFYAFAGLQDRQGGSPGFYRRSSDASLTRTPRRNLTEIYPDGFLPTIIGDLSDLSIGGGVKGDINEWNYDISGVFGSNELDYSVVNTLNASLGPSSPTTFDAGALEFDQLTFNADVQRQFDDLSVAFGAEFRNEGYQITAGEPGSYLTGDYRGIPGVNYIPDPGVNVPVGFVLGVSPNPDPFDQNFGVQFAGGSQVFGGFSPASAVDRSRDAIGAYVDVEWEPSDQILIAGALRYEDYSDFGDIVTGKVSARYDFNDAIAIRGAFSTGFRAPSVQQQFFTSSATVFADGIPFETVTVSAESPGAVALGGGNLQPEESDNYSAGIVARFDNGFYATIDGYKINIDDRIVLTDNINAPLGSDARNALTALSADQLATSGIADLNALQRVRFFINGVNTETEGLDVVLGYEGDIPFGSLDLTAALNLTNTDVTQTPTNAILPGVGLFGSTSTRRFENGAPDHKLVLNANLTSNNDHVFNVRATRYGDVTFTNSGAVLEGKSIFDASADFKVNDRIRIGGGVDNIFDTYPSDSASFNGIFAYSSASPFGFNGRFVFARASYNF